MDDADVLCKQVTIATCFKDCSGWILCCLSHEQCMTWMLQDSENVVCTAKAVTMRMAITTMGAGGSAEQNLSYVKDLA